MNIFLLILIIIAITIVFIFFIFIFYAALVMDNYDRNAHANGTPDCDDNLAAKGIRGFTSSGAFIDNNGVVHR